MGLQMLSIELETLVRNVRMLLELESCQPRERLLPADELRALRDIAETAALDEMSQGRRADAEPGRDLPEGEIGPQQDPHFRNTISELCVLLGARRAVRHETSADGVQLECCSCCGTLHDSTFM